MGDRPQVRWGCYLYVHGVVHLGHRTSWCAVAPCASGELQASRAASVADVSGGACVAVEYVVDDSAVYMHPQDLCRMPQAVGQRPLPQ